MKKAGWFILVLFLTACAQVAPEPAPVEIPVETAPIETPVEAVESVPNVTTSELPKVETVKRTKLVYPVLTYSGAYNGPLYATSEQLGGVKPAPSDYFELLDRNGVSFVLGFIGVDFVPDSLSMRDGVGYIAAMAQHAPGRFIPFIGTSTPGDEVDVSNFASALKTNLASARDVLGYWNVKGFGEMEQYAWGININHQTAKPLIELASSEGVAFMFHPRAGEASSVGAVAKAYPRTTFLIHMFPEDFEKSRENYIEVIKTYDNLYYSIDADHMMYDGRTGLLYKFEDTDDPKKAAQQFVADYDQKEQFLLAQALARYKPLIEAAPDKVMWGTEGGLAYVYEPDVFDRTVKFSRKFIGSLPVEIQSKIAYENALRVFGEGITLDKPISVVDSSDWPYCDDNQMETCDDECGVEDVDTPESEACLVACTIGLSCVELLDDED